MQDHFTGRPTVVHGRIFPSADERVALQDDHRRRLAALARVGTAAAECGLRADSDRDLILLATDEVSLLEEAGGAWSSFGQAIRSLRDLLPVLPLDRFGFETRAENPLEETNPWLIRVGGGVEAWVFLSRKDGSIYKFYLPRGYKRIAAEFVFVRGDEPLWAATAGLGSYRALLEKLMLVNCLGMPTEVSSVTPEGILIAKQTFGDALASDFDTSRILPESMIEVPSRFLRADRDHPRLVFVGDQPFLIGDLHGKNFVYAEAGCHLIDLVAAPWPEVDPKRERMMHDWIDRVRVDPRAKLLPESPDGEL
jgi:hypothetical protein